MAEDVILYPVRNQLKKNLGGRDKLYPFFEMNCIDFVKFEDDFIGKLDVTYRWGSNVSATATLTDNVAQTENGICRLTTGTTANNYIALFPNADEGEEGAAFVGNNSPVIWVRLKSNLATDLKIEVGFGVNDADAGVVNSLSGPSATATDGVVMIYDTSDTGNLHWQGFSVKASGTPAKVETCSLLPVADTYEWVGVAIQAGAVKYMHMDAYGNPNYESGWQAAAVTATTRFVPWIFVQTRSTTSKLVDIDYMIAYQRRTSTDD